MFNYVMVIVLLCWLWICFLALLKAPTWITCALAAASIGIWYSGGGAGVNTGEAPSNLLQTR